MVCKVFEFLMKVDCEQILIFDSNKVAFDQYSLNSSLVGSDSSEALPRPKSYSFSGKSIQDLITSQSVNSNLMHSYISVIFNNLNGRDIHIFPPVFVNKVLNMENYHFLKVTEYFDKNYCCSSKKFGEKSLILYVV